MAWTNPVSPPAGMTSLESFTAWWNSPGGWAAIQASRDPWIAGEREKIAGRRASYSAWQDAWQPLKWEGSPWAAKYGEQEAGMNELAARIKAGVTPEDEQAAHDYAARVYGMTSEAWDTLLQTWVARLTDPAGTAAKYMETIAGSDFAKEQAKADRVMLAQMEEQMGKQLESIFGERGGVGGFQAAYELTTQLENTWLQQQSQEHFSMFNQAVAAVNATNGYYKDLINQGAITSQEYLRSRFDLLQDSFQNYVTMMDQTKKDFETAHTLSENERRRIDSNFASQIEEMEKQLALEMGGQETVDYIKSLYELWGQGFKDKDSMDSRNFEQRQALGGTLLAMGFTAVLTFNPIGLMVGLGLLFIGGILSVPWG